MSLYRNTIILAIASVLSYSCRTDPERVKEKIDWLEKNSIHIRSIDPLDTMFDDLEFLSRELQGVELIGLGEATHGDGSTFLAKTRLIRFLHERMGYEVLAFEGGLLDCFEMEKSFSKGDSQDSAFGKGPFAVWSRSAQVNSLKGYISNRKKSSKPLLLSGFDFQPSGTLSSSDRTSLLVAFYKQHELEFDTSTYHSFFSLFRNSNRLTLTRIRKDSILQEKFFHDLDQLVWLADRYEEIAEEDRVLKQYIHNLRPLYTHLFRRSLNNSEPDIKSVINLRDSMMAINMIWLKEEYFPGKKIIIWGANTHIGYNRDQLKYPDEMKPMGSFLKELYGKRYYSLSFTAFDGNMFSMQQGLRALPQASNKSIEYVWSQCQSQYSFLRTDVFADGPFPEIFPARLFGYLNQEAVWKHMTDGIFFIKTMEASKIIK
ncbi:MAG: erythromycin esterase family protein [Cyclobacteriaceae bacterium]|nr:erythromycin esterase family protein [Cyclobacteriaceae bacterium]